MKSLEDQMSVYAAYHQDARNKATHFVGVPIIVLSLFIPLAWLQVDVGGVAITAAMVVAAALILYYLVLDILLGVVMLGVFIVLGWIGHWIAGLGAVQGWAWFAVLFVGGWILQLVGHMYEGRRPALADNLFQIFVAPIFLAAEVLFALGYKRELKQRVEVNSAAHRARTVPSS
jgi:uncharacterized membrane protein YGL010W